MQRKMMKRGHLSSDKRTRLEELGVQWTINRRNLWDVTWEKHYDELVTYKVKHGDCHVPHNWADNPALGSWVTRTRMAGREGRLGHDRKRRLEALGFEWHIDRHSAVKVAGWKTMLAAQQARWEKMLEALAQFKEQHGHCRVPKSAKNRKLATWADKQRKDNQAGRLSHERQQELETLGFEWSLQAIQTKDSNGKKPLI
jgi:hypothetical protein